MNECTVELKMELVAKEGFGCDGCALNDLPEACQKAPSCTASHRPDGRSIIWVEKSE